MNAAEPQTLNGYAYARNNPSTLSDASGLYAVWDPVSGGYTCYGVMENSPVARAYSR